MQESVAGDAQVLIDAYQQSVRKRGAARRMITLLILSVVAVFGILLGSAFAHFRNSQMGAFRSALGAEVGQLAPRVGVELGGMAQRLYPVYVSSFEQMFAKQGPVMQQRGMEEMKTLDAYAQARWPRIEAGLTAVITNSEGAVQQELGRFLAPSQAQDISLAYGQALQGQLDTVLATELKEHVAIASMIGTNLTQILATEPDIKPPVDMQATLGILLELTGHDLQGGK